MSSVIDEELIELSLKANNKQEILKYFSEKLFKQNRINNAELFLKDLEEREKTAPTYIGYNIAIPHAKSEAVIEQSVVFAKLKQDIVWDDENNKVKLIFMLVVPKEANKEHLALLASLAKALTNEEFRNKLLQSNNKKEVPEIINNVLMPQNINKAKESNKTTLVVEDDNTAGDIAANSTKNTNQELNASNRPYDLVAITACSVGIAHTYIAAENLIKAAKQKGLNIKVQTNGSIGVKNQLTAADINNAKAVIIASDIEVDLEPFANKAKVITTSKDAVYNAEKLIEQALAVAKAGSGINKNTNTMTNSSTTNVSNKSDGTSIGFNFYKNLMSGVSYMIPFIVMGGVFIALAIALSGGVTAGAGAVVDNKFLKAMLDVGVVAFGFVPPILAGYIAFSVAGRPGLAPGMIGGAIAASTGAGFLGGLIAGFVAGYIVKLLLKVKVSKSIETVVPILFIPTIAGGLVAIIMSFIGLPIASFMKNLTAGLALLQQQGGGSAVFLYLLLGLMVAFDMGGPVNKVAFLFGSAMIAEGNATIMGAVSAAIPIPPLAMGLATLLDKKMYTGEEKAAGKAGLFLGLVGITEGAIPFAAADPFRVIPAIMAGSGVAALIAGIFRVADYAPHGGPIVLPVVSGKLAWIIAVIVGIIVTNIVIYALKRIKFSKGT